MNASGASVNASNTSATYIAPIRNATGTTYLEYSATTFEVTYSASVPSDARLKTDISDTSLGLAFIKQLRPVEFKWKDRNMQHVIEDIYEQLYGSTVGASMKSEPSPGVRKHLGFIAQEVKAALDTTGDDYSIYTREQSQSTVLYDLQGVNSKELIAPIVKAIQEQDAVIQTQLSTISLLDNQVSSLTSTTQGQSLQYESLAASMSTLLSLNNLPPMA